MSIKPVKIGVVGCGNICSIYFETCPKFEILEVAACADLLPERAQAKAEEYNLPRSCTVEELLADPEIEIILNLTIPNAHADVAFKAVAAGKSVYNEKPLPFPARTVKNCSDGQRKMAFLSVVRPIHSWELVCRPVVT